MHWVVIGSDCAGSVEIVSIEKFEYEKDPQTSKRIIRADKILDARVFMYLFKGVSFKKVLDWFYDNGEKNMFN